MFAIAFAFVTAGISARASARRLWRPGSRFVARRLANVDLSLDARDRISLLASRYSAPRMEAAGIDDQ